MLDCRWLGHAGVGRVTEHLLRGLVTVPAAAEWHLWGPAEASRLAPGLPRVESLGDPRRLAGQADWRRVPRSTDAMIYMHQTRPLTPRWSVTVIHDTTQLRTTQSRALRAARRLFLQRVARSSAGIITVSEWSRDRIVEDLGIRDERVRVVSNPADDLFGARIRTLRAGDPTRDCILYVGTFAAHKNVPRLIEAFLGSLAYGAGAQLVLVGGRADESALLRRRVVDRQVQIVPRCPQDDLDRLFARAHFIVQPSLEEGFGLPVWEAMSAGIPVCASTGGALSSVAADAVETFDPRDTEALTAALDSTMERAVHNTVETEARSARAFLDRVPGTADFTARFEAAAMDLLGVGNG